MEDVEYLDKGGFGIIYKAIWLDKNKKVVLKCLNNLNNNLNEFLNEVWSIVVLFVLFFFNFD